MDDQFEAISDLEIGARWSACIDDLRRRILRGGGNYSHHENDECLHIDQCSPLFAMVIWSHEQHLTQPRGRPARHDADRYRHVRFSARRATDTHPAILKRRRERLENDRAAERAIGDAHARTPARHCRSHGRDYEDRV